MEENVTVIKIKLSSVMEGFMASLLTVEETKERLIEDLTERFGEGNFEILDMREATQEEIDEINSFADSSVHIHETIQ